MGRVAPAAFALAVGWAQLAHGQSPGPASAPRAAAAPALVVTAPTGVRADGRSILSFEVAEAPARRGGELAGQPEVPAVSCNGAAPLPPLQGRATALAPALASGGRLDCTVTYRGATASVPVELAAPAAGLFAQASRAWITAGDGSIVLRTFGSRAPAGTALKVKASAGTVSVRGATIELTPPRDRRPRMITLAYTDGIVSGAAFVPVWGSTELEVEANNGETVQVRIGGQWYGPVAVRRRLAKLPILVPPGVRHAVVRATDAKGYALESSADLKTPDSPRLAIVAPNSTLGVGTKTFITVALATADGHPADERTILVAKAGRGEVGRPEFLGGGLWRLPYAAPTTVGADRVEVSVKGDPGAAAQGLAFDVVAGPPASLRLTLPDGPFIAGQALEVKVRVLDAHGNRRNDASVTATVGGVPVPVSASGQDLRLAFSMPKRLPPELRLVVVAGEARSEVPLSASAALPQSASIDTELDGRSARVRIIARDSFGNPTAADALTVSVVGASPTRAEPRAGEYRLIARANEGARSALVTVSAGGQELARRQIRFDPPAGTVLLGGYLSSGWLSNGGAVQTVRFGGGVGVRRAGRRFEAALLVGAEFYAVEDRVELQLGTMPETVDRSIEALLVPVALRGRVRVSQRLGASIGLSLVPVRASLEVSPAFQAADAYAEYAIGARGTLAVDAALGPGRVNLGVGYGTAKLEEGLVLGNLEGFSAFAGYEWWFVDFGP